MSPATATSNVAIRLCPFLPPAHIASYALLMTTTMTSVLDSCVSTFGHSYDTPTHGKSASHEGVSGSVVPIPSLGEAFDILVQVKNSGTLSIDILMDKNLIPLKLQKLPSN